MPPSSRVSPSLSSDFFRVAQFIKALDSVRRDANRRLLNRVNVWGEVLDVRRTDRLTVVELLDANELASVEVWLDDAVAIAVGDYVCVTGRAELSRLAANSSLALKLTRAVLRDNKGPSSRLEKTRRRVAAEKRDRPAVRLPRSGLRDVALVTSEGSHAQEDILRAAGERSGLNFHLIPVRVTKPDEVAWGLRAALDMTPPPDVVVVARGGGSHVDLMAFDRDEVIDAAAAVASSVPLISALGHSRTKTAVDALASWRCNTPGQAGEELRRRGPRASGTPAAAVPTVEQHGGDFERVSETSPPHRIWRAAVLALAVGILLGYFLGSSGMP